MAKDEETTEEQPKSNKMMLIIIVVAVLAIAGGAAFFFLSGGEEEAAAADTTEETAEATNEAIYFDLKPMFVVNYNWKGRQRYVQIGVAVMARKTEVIEAITQHMPVVRNQLIMVFGAQEFEGLRTQEGKEKLREIALEKVNTVVNEELGYSGVEQILFTNFVMQ